MHNHNSRTPGFGVFLGEAADGGGDGFPQPPWRGAVNRGPFQGEDKYRKTEIQPGIKRHYLVGFSVQV